MTRLLLLFALGCGGGDPCDLENVMADELGPFATDCGTAGVAGGDEAWQAAHDCIAEAHDSRTPFVAIIDDVGVDGRVQTGFASNGSQIHTYSYDAADGPARVRSTVCGSLYTSGTCQAKLGELCVECVDAGGTVDVCIDGERVPTEEE